MTLNAPWIEQLTLRSQVIRETKGQAKQEDPQTQLPVPFPQSEKEAKCALAQTNILLTLQPSVHGSEKQVGGASNLERNEANEMNQGWKKLTGTFACGPWTNPAEVDVDRRLTKV